MTTTADRLRTYWSDRQVDRGQLVSFVTRYWEVGLMGAIVLVGLIMRLAGLDARAIHHDESIHVWYSYNWAGEGTSLFSDGVGALWDWGNYTHDPTYHGPFQIFGTALLFKFFDDSDFTGRLLPALFGTALIALPFFLRGFLGRAGMFFAAGLIAFSPVLMYVSRFARNDIYIAVFTLGLAILILRYLKEEKQGYLYGIPLLLMLSFATKEMAFITTAIFLVYVEYQLAQDLFEQMRAKRTFTAMETTIAYAVLLPTAWLIVALWPLLENVRKSWSLEKIPASGHVMIVLGTFALPQFAGAIQVVPFIGQGSYMGEDALMRTSVLFAIAATAAIGLMWNPRVWGICAAIFYVPYFLLFTTFFANGGDVWNPVGDFWSGAGTDSGGFWTGIWGSLDYWLDQHDVRRGAQPNYYYFLFMPVYEFLPLVFALGGTLYYAFRGKIEHRLLAASAVLLVFAFSVMPEEFPLVGQVNYQIAFLIAIGAVLLLPMDSFVKFLVYWTLAILFAMSWAGEKMPWLTAHLALPLALLAAKILNDICEGVVEQIWAFTSKQGQPSTEPATPKRRSRAKAPEPPTSPDGGMALHPLIPVALAASFAASAVIVFIFAGPASGASVLAWLFAIAAAGVVVVAARYGSIRLAGQVALLALFAALSVFTLRAGAIAIYDEGDVYTDLGPGGVPPELLIYAQGAPDLDKVMAEIEAFAAETGQGEELHVVYDNSVNIWPWPWYLRDYNAGPIDSVETYVPEPGSVALVDIAKRQSIEDDYADKVLRSQEYRHMWWFHETYKGINAWGFLRDTVTLDYASTWRSYFIDRIVPTDIGVQTLVTVRDSETAEIVVQERLAYKDVDGWLRDNSYVGGDQRYNIERYQIEPVDRVAFFFGSEAIEPVETQTPQFEGTVPGDVQRVIGEPGQGDGQLNQPAGITTDADGNIYVVDTLNHRIQKFAPDGTFIAAAGSQGAGNGQFGNPRSEEYQVDDGPWGIASGADGNVYVTDTWFNVVEGRVQAFDSDLQFTSAWGADDSLFGPRDAAIDADGNVLVMDTGRKRIIRYSPDGEFIEQFGTEGTEPGQFDEPTSLSVTSNGDIYVADYWNRRVQHFDSKFTFLSEFRIGSWGSRGVTDRAYIVALDDGTILATDPANASVLVYSADGRWLAKWHLVDGDVVSRPVAITLGSDGQVYVTDGATSQIRAFPLEEILVQPAPESTGTPAATATPVRIGGTP